MLINRMLIHALFFLVLLIRFFGYFTDAKNNQLPQTKGRRIVLFLFVYIHNFENKFSGLVCIYREVYACVVIDTFARLSPIFFYGV
jgi:hypothetical protein